jgi:NADP-dependent 3-hydroxy acid dehydrogenase YdfG
MTGKIALITGGGSGIGRAVAVSLARRGYRLALTGRRIEPLEETATLCTAEGAEAFCITSDVSVRASVETCSRR